jgi:hypothetical protein
MIRIVPAQRPWLRRVVAATVLILVSLLLVVSLRGGAAAVSPADEMIRFNHSKHVAASVQCLYCHPGALNGAVAGLPSLEKCMGCHRSVEISSENGQAYVDVLVRHWEEGLPLRWEKTYDQPDFVTFNHRPHIANRVNCENCHGDVGSMATVREAYRINMGFCLHCHRRQPAEKVLRLESCATCHN